MTHCEHLDNNLYSVAEKHERARRRKGVACQCGHYPFHHGSSLDETLRNCKRCCPREQYAAIELHPSQWKDQP